MGATKESHQALSTQQIPLDIGWQVDDALFKQQPQLNYIMTVCAVRDKR